MKRVFIFITGTLLAAAFAFFSSSSDVLRLNPRAVFRPDAGARPHDARWPLYLH
jgi:hypothetical protein